MKRVSSVDGVCAARARQRPACARPDASAALRAEIDDESDEEEGKDELKDGEVRFVTNNADYATALSKLGHKPLKGSFARAPCGGRDG